MINLTCPTLTSRLSDTYRYRPRAGGGGEALKTLALVAQRYETKEGAGGKAIRS